MNFDDTPQEAEFRSSVRHWIDDNALLRKSQFCDHGFG